MNLGIYGIWRKSLGMTGMAIVIYKTFLIGEFVVKSRPVTRAPPVMDKHSGRGLPPSSSSWEQ